MPFRARFKRALGRNASADSSSTSLDNKDSSTYKPGEAIPPSRFKNPPNKSHTKALEAFQFGEGGRKKSDTSMVSPGGSRVASPRNSWENTPAMNDFRKSTHANGQRSHIGHEVQNASDIDDNDTDAIGAADTASSQATDPMVLVTCPTAEDHTPFSEADIEREFSKEKTAADEARDA